MGLLDIKQKLRLELEKEIKEESQVVYILSRIRKILEIDKKEKKYKVIKLYCDWALHPEIENVEPIRPLLNSVIEGNRIAEANFVSFTPFYKEFSEFLIEYDLPKDVFGRNNWLMFDKFLSQIYSDTPLIIKTITRKKNYMER